jgi:hypothetical protein
MHHKVHLYTKFSSIDRSTFNAPIKSTIYFTKAHNHVHKHIKMTFMSNVSQFCDKVNLIISVFFNISTEI